MDVKKIALIAVAMLVALGAAFGVNQMMRGSAAPAARAAAAPAITGPKVMIATRALPVGTILTADALRLQPWPENLVRAEAYYVEGSADMNALTGSVVRVAMSAGQPITRGSLVNPQDRGFLAAALGAGMRAVTVPLSADQGVAGFVFPGDHVDLLLTMSLSSEDDDKAKLYTSETIVRNLRVLAVDQRTAPSGENGQSTPTIFGTVTLEATPQIAESIAVSRQTGTISLALRSIADNASDLEAAIASGQVNVPRDGDRAGESRLLAGGSRPEVGSTGATTGGQVSRYLRRTLPTPVDVARRRAVVNAIESAANGNNNRPGPVGPASPGAMGNDGRPVGPTVRVVRGDQVTVVPVGGN
jgi:pilus assembly protein CpaB